MNILILALRVTFPLHFANVYELFIMDDLQAKMETIILDLPIPATLISSITKYSDLRFQNRKLKELRSMQLWWTNQFVQHGLPINETREISSRNTPYFATPTTFCDAEYHQKGRCKF